LTTKFPNFLGTGCLVLWALTVAAPLSAQDDAGCSSCHDLEQKIAGGVHAGVGCAGCHPKHEEYPHPSGIAKPACAGCHPVVARRDAMGVHGQARAKGNEAAPDCAVCHGGVHEIQRPDAFEFRKTVPETCGMCHDGVAKEYLTSVHGQVLQQGVRDTPVCTDCHGEHDILPPSDIASQVHPTHVRETCARCHGDVRLSRRFDLPGDRIISFDASFHGLAAKAGSQVVANCASCHGYHNILPSSDPKSMVSSRNLPATCGKCHPGAGSRFAIGTIHWTEEGAAPMGVEFVRKLYLFLIPLLIGLMTFHNLGDFVRKIWCLRLRASSPPAGPESSPMPAHREIRMHRSERIQHAIMVVSFAVLVWTGFALKYPDGWWAQPLIRWESTLGLRGFVHRIAGVVMIAASFVHVFALIVDRRLRRHWREMWPRAADVGEAWRGLLYALGLRRAKPYRSPHSYVEKAEYWAVIWGTAVMALTGVMLWANNLVLAWLPKSWLDVATAVHFYEAVLATLAIVVWHFYFVIFDPDVYPMDTAWLTGLSVRQRDSHHDPGSTEKSE